MSAIFPKKQTNIFRLASKTNQIEEKEKEGNLNKRVVKLKHAEKESKEERKLIEEALLSFGLLKKMNASMVDRLRLTFALSILFIITWY